MVIADAGRGSAVAVNDTLPPADNDASTVFVPAVAGSVNVFVAIPDPFVTVAVEPRDPPVTAVQFTTRPVFGLPNSSVTRTESGDGRVVPVVTLWPSPPAIK